MKVIIVISSIILAIIIAVILYFVLRCKKCGGTCLNSSKYVCVNGVQCPLKQYISSNNVCCPDNTIAMDNKCVEPQLDRYGVQCYPKQLNSQTNVCCEGQQIPCGLFCANPGQCVKLDDGEECPANYITNGGHCCGSVACGDKCCPPGSSCVDGDCYDVCPYSNQHASQAFCVDNGYTADTYRKICAQYDNTNRLCCANGQYSDGKNCINCTNDLKSCGNSCCPPGQECDNNGICCDINEMKQGYCCSSQVYVNGVCCPLGQEVCYDGKVCCPNNYSCVNNQCVRSCNGTQCAEFQTCKDDGSGVKTCTDPPCPGPQINGSSCCENGQYSSGGKCFDCDSNMPKCGTSCCEPGQTCYAGKYCH